MTIQARSFNKLVLALLVCCSFKAVADDKLCPTNFDVLIRDKGEGYTMQSKTIERLYCTNKFEGPDFKVVYSTEEEAIAFNHENKDLVKKAANVFYNLSIAKHFGLMKSNLTMYQNFLR